MNGKNLVVFHVGPVQDFILQARRSRDLWFGSWLLSELSKAAALEVVKQNGNDVNCLIFPAPNDLQQLASENFNVANKVVALVKQSPPNLGNDVKDAILNRLCEIRDDAYAKVNGSFNLAIARDQVEDMLEFFWVACPVNGNYSQARAQAESLMAARKVTRDFAPVTWGAPVPKSSLDGQRESVIPEQCYDQMTEEQLRRNYGVQVGERLCGVGLLKRHGQRGIGSDRFFSTSHVAALPLLERLVDNTATDEYIRALQRLGVSSDEFGNVPMPHPVLGHYDGHLLFEERLSEFFEDRAELEQAKQALSSFRQTAFRDLPVHDRSPIPYYALLLADGDRMGETIDMQKSDDQHRALSKSLTNFARDVVDIVRGHKGSLVYCGGDDVLAFLPLHKVLSCARDLSETFQGGWTQAKHVSLNPPPTLSVGIVVAHHLDPLSDTLTLARAAERAAKSVDGKNALAVTVSKRSGTERTVADTWGRLDRRLADFVNLHRRDAIPDSAAYELGDLALRLRLSEQESNETLQDLAQKEAVRILRRKEAQRGQEGIAKEVLEELEGLINQQTVSVEELANELIIAREFAAAEEQANILLERRR